jgi:raffinose/stachyose/melibiose transport system substrate-binding protein
MIIPKRLSLYIISILLLCTACLSIKEESEYSERKNILYVNLGLYTPDTKLAFGDPLQASKKIAEEYKRLHPEIDIKFVQQVNIKGSQEGEWLKTQLVGGIAPDIVSQNAEIIWADISKGWYVPLDSFLQKPNPYIKGNKRWIESFVNQALVNSKRAPDGKLYSLSIDVVETAVYYNKTLFNKLNLQIPETWENFIHLQKVLLDHGITPMPSSQNLVPNWGQDIIFDMLYYDIIEKLDVEPSLKSQQKYLTHYLIPKEVAFLFGKGFFTRKDPRWVEMHRLLKDWRQYWAKELKNTDTSRLFLTQRVGMVWDGSWFSRRLLLDPYINFEWGIFYLPKITKSTSPYGNDVAASVIGGSGIQLHITNSAEIYNHLDLVIDFLMFYTAPQNFERVLNETMMFLPNIKGIKVAEELKPINEIFQRRYCSIKWLESFGAKYKSYWQRNLDLFLNDGLTIDQYLAKLETNFTQYINETVEEQNWDFSAYEKKWQQNGVALE